MFPREQLSMAHDLIADGSPPGRGGGRFLLWIDAVGGFLVCPGEEVTVGQALPENRVDIPILADISRQHFRLRRQAGAYLVVPTHSVRLGGKTLRDKTLLSHGDELEFGSGVRLRFLQPHALSSTARLELVSGHRTQPPCDGVLLFAESCILGPHFRNHVYCRDWSGVVVILRQIFRQDQRLYCRATPPLEIDGQLVHGRGRLTPNSRICGGDFSMSLEELDKCTT
jgi:hypothetical protein